jgi:hypothetical protein
MFADVLPLEHAILVVGAAALARGVRWRLRASLLVAASLVGFAVHASHDHVAFANRDGGRPMYEPDVVRQSFATSGLLFVDTDHGFNLAHDPGLSPSRGLLAARSRGDDHDRLLYELLKRPPAYTYTMGAEGPSVRPYSAPGSPDAWTFEAEADWPPIAQAGGFAIPEYTSGCAPRVLTLSPVPAKGRATTTLELPVPREGTWSVAPRALVPDRDARGAIYLVAHPDEPLSRASVSWSLDGAREGCLDLEVKEVALRGHRAYLVVEAAGGRVMLDRTSLRAAPSSI